MGCVTRPIPTRDNGKEFILEIRPNRVKHKLANGESALIASGFDSGDQIDAFGPFGFDGVWLEGEHGPVDAAQIGDLTRACDIWGMTSVVRVNRNDQNLIYRTFDRGAQAICVPHVNTREEAENVVAGGKFAPIGQRGLFTSRQGYGVSNYLDVANDETLLIILIEDIIAVNNLDEILKVDHIDVFFVAPSDLAASMGMIGQVQSDKVQATIDGALAKIVDAGKTAGTMCADYTWAEKYTKAGVQCLLTPAGPWMAAGAKQFRDTVEAAS
jgi:4-hydroxy-2-oxoheptanedioate aldolase